MKTAKQGLYTGSVYPNQITVKDIVVSICREGRYAGACELWYPVGLHTMVVCDLLADEFKLDGWMHDGVTETVSGDLPSPTKRSILGAKAWENRQMVIGYKLLNVPLPTKEATHAVHVADRRALQGEIYVLGNKRLKKLFKIDEEAAMLTQKYYDQYPVTDLVDGNGKAQAELARRYKEYRKLRGL